MFFYLCWFSTKTKWYWSWKRWRLYLTHKHTCKGPNEWQCMHATLLVWARILAFRSNL